MMSSVFFQRLTHLCAAAAFSAAALTHGMAQESYPVRAITMVVPFPPGGVADTVGRPMAEAMGRILKQSVVVENRAGAGGGIGFAHVAKARPDGYTILMALSSVSVIPEADRILGKAPSYELNQLKPIARITADPTVLVCGQKPRGRPTKSSWRRCAKIPPSSTMDLRATTAPCMCRWSN
jgi:tripartite-type tricarboxylate transporter receptor subunit TctC